MRPKQQNQIKKRRTAKVRAKIRGTAERPRLSVFRSNKHIFVQLINDIDGKTIVSVSSIKEKTANQKKGDAAFLAGEKVAKLAAEKGVSIAVFDRGGYKYHGRVKAVCEGARKGGLKI